MFYVLKIIVLSKLAFSLVPTTNDFVVFISCVFVCLAFLAVDIACGTGKSAVRPCRFSLVRDDILVVRICSLT